MPRPTAVNPSPALDLARELLRRPSLTPADAGCMEVVAARLTPLGFQCESHPFGEVDNLWARRGSGAPLLVFLGHTDVVPPGPKSNWRFDPFAAEVSDGVLYGRGAADMKGAVAAFVVALERFLAHTPEPRGSVAVMLTSDEEGRGLDGVRKLMPALGEKGVAIDHCLVGEPSCATRLGDRVRQGRRGSISGRLQVVGVQGHVAYPEDALNPIHLAAPAIAALTDLEWDRGNRHFPPTSLQISNITAGTGADNVIPGDLELLFNLRFSPATPAVAIRERVEALLNDAGFDYRLDWHLSGEPFLTEGGALLDAVLDSSLEVTGQRPVADTGGGTSDGRFVAPTGAEVMELGLVATNIHGIDEQVPVADLDALAAIYQGVLQRLLG